MEKEQYKAMKDAWARSVNDKDNKPYKDKTYGNKVNGKIRAEHYMLYNILRNLPKERGFEPCGEGFDRSIRILKLGRNSKYWIEDLLHPFGQTITADELKELL